MRNIISSQTGARTSAAAALATLGLAAVSWVLAIRQMDQMGMVVGLGSLGFFAGLWMSMMAAMMLPGAVPAVSKHAGASGRFRSVPVFIGSYLAVWALVGAAIYVLYRVHGFVAAGFVVVAVGLYELSPLKQTFRRRCRRSVRSGFEFGLGCAGCSIGLMVMTVAIGLMSVAWMAVIAVIVLVQKLLPPRAALDVPLALAIIVLGAVIVLSNGSVLGITPPM